MVILKTKNYKKNSVSLSKKDKVLLSKQEKLLVKNIFDSKLQTKKLKGFPDEHVYSFRITSSIDFTLYILLTDLFKVYYLTAAVASFIVSALYNFSLNRKWLLLYPI